MSDSIFRELFVELGEATMAALQGAVDQARQARIVANIYRGPTVSQKLDLLLKGARVRYGWKGDALHHRMARERSCLIRFVRACGHPTVVAFPEEILDVVDTDVASNFFDWFDGENVKACAGCVK